MGGEVGKWAAQGVTRTRTRADAGESQHTGPRSAGAAGESPRARQVDWPAPRGARHNAGAVAGARVVVAAGRALGNFFNCVLLAAAGVASAAAVHLLLIILVQ